MAEAEQAEVAEHVVEVAEEKQGAAPKGSLAHEILYGSSKEVKLRAQDWAYLCTQDLAAAIYEILNLVVVLAGLPRAIKLQDLEADPATWVIALPDWVKSNNIDPTFYMLLPSVGQSRRSIANLEKFIAQGIGEQNGAALLEGQLVASLTRWLLVLPNAQIRAVRHVATIAALAVAEALGFHVESLRRSHDTLSRQLDGARGSVNPRQEQQLKRDVHTSAKHTKEMNTARNQLLETIVPNRSRDISDVVRMYTLGAIERLMRAAPEMHMQNKWTSRVFLMCHDPVVEVRSRALAVITQWFLPSSKLSAEIQEHLAEWAKNALPHIVERTFDVDARVAAAAVRCLRQPALADIMQDSEFDTVVNLVIGGLDEEIRQEAALFINQHVFQDPGICSRERSKKRSGGQDVPVLPGELEDGREEALEPGDGVKERENSVTAISMLLEFMENYLDSRLRATERVVAAFWRRAPSLSHWGTMLNLCLVGERARRVGARPISSRQRLVLLYIIEAAVRLADEDVKTARNDKDKEAATLRMTEACNHFLPEMPHLMDICRPEEEQFLLLSHVCKILLEFAVANAQNQVLVNAKAMCQALRRAIEDTSPMDTMKYCADSLLSLAKNFDEAKTTFLDLAKTVHTNYVDLLRDNNRLQELRSVLPRFLTLVNRGIDMSFGSTPMLQKQLDLLRARVAWSRERRQMLEQVRSEAKEEPMSPRSPRSPLLSPGGETAGPRKRRRLQSRPDDVPDVRLTLQMLEAVVVSVMWHVRMAFWVETQGVSPEGRKAAELQVAEMLQGFSELPLLRAELPRMMTELRNVCVELLDSDFHAQVQIAAFSAYMTLLQNCVGVSDTLSLELDESGRPAPATGWGATYKVNMPKEHMQALFKHLNALYVAMSDAEVEGLPFNAEGKHFEPKNSIHPAPSQGTMTSLRYLATQTMQFPGADPEAAGHMEPDKVDLLLFAVLATRQIAECELEEIIAGPMATLVLTQLEKARPKPLREAAASLLRRHKTSATLSEEFAESFFSVQQEAIESLFRCAGAEAAMSLSLSMVRQWGVRPLPWMERPLYVVLREAILTCITPDCSRLPLLDAFMPWIKSEFVRESRCKEIEDELQKQCATAGVGESNAHISRMLRRLQHLPPA